MKLYTNALFAENIALYQRLGYVREREEPFKGGTAVHMRKALPDRETARQFYSGGLSAPKSLRREWNQS